jgi:hypothetical protein
MLGLASPPVRHLKRLPKERPKDCSGSISESTIYKPKKAAFRRRTIPMRSLIAEKGLKGRRPKTTAAVVRFSSRAGGGVGLRFSNLKPSH